MNIFNHCFNSDNAEYFFTRTTKINCHIAYQAQLQNLTAIIKLVLNRLVNDCKKIYQGQNHFCELLNQSLTCLALLYIESPSHTHTVSGWESQHTWDQVWAVALKVLAFCRLKGRPKTPRWGNWAEQSMNKPNKVLPVITNNLWFVHLKMISVKLSFLGGSQEWCITFFHSWILQKNMIWYLNFLALAVFYNSVSTRWQHNFCFDLKETVHLKVT